MAEADPLAVLSEGDPRIKAQRAREFRASILGSDVSGAFVSEVPDRPARPDRPPLVQPRELAKRGLGSVEGRAALLHAIAHIELNAIDLAADMVARFSGVSEITGSRAAFLADWSSVCDDEARHFVMVADRLEAMGHSYGEFPAHDGLWDAAYKTRHDIAARLAIAPLVLEARGLDVTPGMIAKLEQAGDMDSAAVLQVIYDEEIGHVAIGMRWFRHVAENRGRPAKELFQDMVREHFGGSLKPPFNRDARGLADFPEDFYAEFTVWGQS